MKNLLSVGIVSILLCASAPVYSHETKTDSRADVNKAQDGKAVATIEGRVRSVDLEKRTIVVVTKTGQEYVLPYLDQAAAPVVVGQQVTITITYCIAKGYCATITIKL